MDKIFTQSFVSFLYLILDNSVTKVIFTIFWSYPIYLLIVTLIYQASVGPLCSTAGEKKNLLGTSLIFSMTFKSLIWSFPEGWILVGFLYSKNFSVFSFTDWRWNGFALQPWNFQNSWALYISFLFCLQIYQLFSDLISSCTILWHISCIITNSSHHQYSVSEPLYPSSQAFLGHFLSFRFL